MNYSTSIAYNTRNSDFEDEYKGFKFPVIKEVYVKIFAIMASLGCAAVVLVLMNM